MSRRQKLLSIYIIVVIVYIFGTFFLTNTKLTTSHYHLSLVSLRLIDLTFIIPFAAIWFCAIWGYYKLSEYASLISKNKDGRAVKQLAIGVGFLAFWLPINSLFSTYAGYIAYRNPGLSSTVAILENYISLIIPFIGFSFITVGTRALSDLSKTHINLFASNTISLIVIVIGVFYVHLVSSTHNRINSIYHIPIDLILITLVIPYIFMWLIGTRSFYELYKYRLRASGIIYRKFWSLLAIGIGWILVISILIQYLTTINNRLDKLSLSSLLILIYLLLILLAVGFILIAVGVNKVKKIEEV